jgi:alpha-beta hydrolase superfamily lysophospholipase
MDLLDHPIIAARYFFPRSDPPPEPFFVDVDGARLACWRSAPHPGAPTLVHFHGNGEVVADQIPWLTDAFLAMGVNVFLAEYRGYGPSSGEPLIGRMLDDVEAISRAVGEDTKLVVFGRSVGSIFAIDLVHRRPDAAGLVLESGIADVHERLRLRVQPWEMGSTEEDFEAACATRLDHCKKLGAYKGPLLVMHTRQDGLVDLSHGERNHAWAGGNDKKLVVFDHGDHNSIFFANQARYLREVEELIARATAR